MSLLQYQEFFDARKLQFIINNWESIEFTGSEIKEMKNGNHLLF